VFEGTCEEAVVTYFKALFDRCSGGAERNHESVTTYGFRAEMRNHAPPTKKQEC
jgi:hypothetical protein